jgi:hypothetical protein
VAFGVFGAFSSRTSRRAASRPAACNARERHPSGTLERYDMNNIIYIVGLVVVVIAVLSFFGLR